ncbi:MAG TPA: hypothetical protein VEH78_05925 [Pseudolabrys sp.]|nr:hypothetical protein [Pseudolabrys sp.]
MRRNLLRPLWVILALLFLLEAWLWDHLEPVVARIVNVVPWGKIKVSLAGLIENLPPYFALTVFIIPIIVVLLPLKVLEVYFIATSSWLGAITMLVVAKLLGLGVTAFVFEVTRDKLLQIGWFHRMYDWFVWLRGWARSITEPVREQIREFKSFLKPQRAGRFMRLLMRLRRRAFAPGNDEGA